MKNFSLLAASVLSILSITSTAAGATSVVAPSDPKITQEARALYLNLAALAEKKILFGHQLSTMLGVNWEADPDPLRSDVRSACGKLPAVYGWDYTHRDQHRSTNGEGLMASRIREAYERGGVNTMSWHMANPVTGGDFEDKTPAVREILPGGSKHEQYKANLDEFATYISSLKDKNGTPIPIIFRPFHEHTGKWFWWGKGNCSEKEYIKLWRFTVDYLRNQKGLHQLLYAYSPGKNLSGKVQDYLYGYPGDDAVDIMGYDHYCQDVREALPGLRIVVKQAQQRHKVAAFTETGVAKGLAQAAPGKYFTERLLNPLKSDSSVQGIAYLMTWRNGSAEKYWIPVQGNPFLSDFKAFASDPILGFEGEFGNIYK